MNRSRAVHILLIVSMVGALFAACAHFPTSNYTVAVPAAAKNRDVLELVIDAAKSVNLPPVTKVDKANGVVEFGGFGRSVTGYTAQVRQRSDGQLDVTVKRGSAYIPLPVDEKAKEFVSAIQSRLDKEGMYKVVKSGTANKRSQPTAIPSSRPPSEKSDKIYLIAIKNSNIRATPTTKSQILTTIKKGTKLEKIGESREWFKVKLPSGEIGHIFKPLAIEIL